MDPLHLARRAARIAGLFTFVTLMWMIGQFAAGTGWLDSVGLVGAGLSGLAVLVAVVACLWGLWQRSRVPRRHALRNSKT
jgi:hypothetical protein